ncbi:MAG TPA: hypothetical protein VFL91_04745 [Thermomicrobiales bacterium]|nr:hypothetical protein [Thermomicrobiales bacterium]
MAEVIGGLLVEARPRMLKVDLSTSRYEEFFAWPEERWVKPGAVTGACWHDWRGWRGAAGLTVERRERSRRGLVERLAAREPA